MFPSARASLCVTQRKLLLCVSGVRWHGSFANETGMIECLRCDFGLFGAVSGLAECDPCPAGSFSKFVHLVAAFFMHTLFTAPDVALHCCHGHYVAVPRG